MRLRNAQRDRRRMKPSPLHLISAEAAQLDNAHRIVSGLRPLISLSAILTPRFAKSFNLLFLLIGMGVAR
jgi:hypothetical protein